MGHFEPSIEKVVITPEPVVASQYCTITITITELERFLALYSGEIYSGEAE